jgi:methionine-rich copper-binding protein CopC
MVCSGQPSRGKAGTLILAAVLLLAPPPARGHAFPDHADPRVGSTVNPSPAEVRIWFDGEIEPVFSTIRVENETKQRIDRGDGGVSSQDNRLLAVRIPPLVPGKYRVYWSVVARDGHRTEGDYPFKVK